MQPYKRTQIGWVMLGLGALAVAATAYSFFVINGGRLATTDGKLSLGIGVALAVIFFVLFPSLTLSVTAERIVASFGLGLIRFTFPTTAVAGARHVRNHFLMGLGIRFLPGILLLNISGLDAVEIKLTDRKKLLRLGTNDPEGLLAALKRHSGAGN